MNEIHKILIVINYLFLPLIPTPCKSAYPTTSFFVFPSELRAIEGKQKMVQDSTTATSFSSWIDIPEDSDFSIQNLPFGVCSIEGYDKRRHFCVTAIGNKVVNLQILQDAGAFQDIPNLSATTFSQPTLNEFLGHPSSVWAGIRQRLVALFATTTTTNDGSSGPSSFSDFLRLNPELQRAVLVDQSKVSMHLPVSIGDYTDFYSSREHATNVGTMFRSKENALQPNWLHLPVGYHGRSSTVVCSGTSVRRPNGQVQKDPNDPKCGSIFRPCRLLDFELEVAFYVGGPPNPMGTPLTIEQAKDRIFGFCLMNDWSARDIQKWEYVPLGPFTAKNFATSVSPWIIPTAALEPFRCTTSTGSVQDNPSPLPYLTDPTYSSYDITLTASIQSSRNKTKPHVVSESNFKYLYWNAAQQLVHHSVTGCQMNPGDLLASGTISGQSKGAFGSMLELSWKGSREVSLGDDDDGQPETRKFLQDYDTVILKGWCVRGKDEENKKGCVGRVGFGECSGMILPAFVEKTTCTEKESKEADTATVPTTPDTMSMENDINNSPFQNFKLYSYWRSSSAWRVRIALQAKGIPYEIIPINLHERQQKTKDFLETKNSMGEVPVLEYTTTINGKTKTMTQSIAMIEFLDLVVAPNQKSSLIPKDPMDKIIAMEMVELINSGIQPLQNVPFLKGLETQSERKIIANDFGQTIILRGLTALEALITKRKKEDVTKIGPYCMGNFSPTIVDVCLIPQLYNARRFGINVKEEFPTLASIDHICESHPWFVPAHANVQVDTEKQA